MVEYTNQSDTIMKKTKTQETLPFMRHVLILILISISGILAGQECKIDLHSLAQPDFNMIRLNNFGQSKLFKIVLSEGFDTIANKDVINQLSQWFLNQNSQIITVNTNNIKILDDSCHYLIIGLTGKLNNLSIFDLPVKLNNNIGTIGTIERTDDDAITIINESAQCAAVIGNSYAALRNISCGRFLGLYNYHIVKNNRIRYLGNLIDNRFNSDSLVDLVLLRKENYSQKIDNKYIEACFSCKYNTINQFQGSIDDVMNSFDDFCRLYEVKKPSQKLKYFIHWNQLEINIISGDPKPGVTGGLVIDSLIHTVGMDKELLTHEGIHFIFNSNLRSPNAFFNEGIPLSFTLYQHPERITCDCILIQDNLDIQDLITGKTEFWKGPYKNGQCVSYQISGLFIKYLIDKYGIDKLKRFYQYAEINNGFKAVYNLELVVVIAEWKCYVLKTLNNYCAQ